MPINHELYGSNAVNIFLATANYDLKTIGDYDNLLRLKLKVTKEHSRKTIMASLSEIVSNENVQDVFNDLIVYGFMIKRSNGKYFLQ